SRKPSGPIVPVSWPPWPASRTMRPTFRPRTRIMERSPVELLLAGVATSDDGFGATGVFTSGAVSTTAPEAVGATFVATNTGAFVPLTAAGLVAPVGAGIVA